MDDKTVKSLWGAEESDGGYLILETGADWNDKPCPTCGAPTMDNGLIFWCDQGHVFSYDASQLA